MATVRITGLPPAIDAAYARRVFGAYVTLVDLAVQKARTPSDKASATLRLASQEDAQYLVDEVSGKLVQGLAQPVFVDFADGPGQLPNPAALSTKHGLDDGQAQPAAAKRPRQGTSEAAHAVGEVRFGTAEEAQVAVDAFHGSELGGVEVQVQLDSACADGTKLTITGLPPAMHWLALKKHFEQAGHVTYAGIGMATGSEDQDEGAVNQEALGEVRFDTKEQAEQAVEEADGMGLKHCTLRLEVDPLYKFGNKVLVRGLDSTVTWQELRDHFAPVGRVTYTNVMPKTSGKACAIVRFETSEVPPEAIMNLEGMEIDGHQLHATLDAGSKDGTKVRVTNLPERMEWQEVKDLCGQFGHVVFCEVAKDGGSGGFAEVRYETAEQAEAAVATYDGSQFADARIRVHLDPVSKDGTRVLVHGLPPFTEWQELKDHFSQIGPVVFANVAVSKGKGKGKGKDIRGLAPGPVLPLPVSGFLGRGFGKGVVPLGKGAAPSLGSGVPSGVRTGEVRFGLPEEAQRAIQELDGSVLGGSRIAVRQHGMNNAAGTKLLVLNVPAACSWPELKEHFSRCGEIAYCDCSPVFMPQAAPQPAPQPLLLRPVAFAGGVKGGFRGGCGGLRGAAPALAPVGRAQTFEVRFTTREAAERAIHELNGSALLGAQIRVLLHGLNNPNGTKLLVLGVPAACSWGHVREHFQPCGEVEFVGKG